MKEIKCPQINANDDLYFIGELYCKNAQKVQTGERIMSIGSSKITAEVEATDSGYIAYAVELSDEVKPGATIAVLFETEEECHFYLQNPAKSLSAQDNKTQDYLLTQPAQQFMLEHSISKEKIKSLNKKIITVQDLKTLLENTSSDYTKEMSLNQRMTAAKVVQSHHEIPQAFQLMKADCSRCEKFLKSYYEKTGILIGYGEIMVMIAAELFDDFPNCFARYVSDCKIQQAVAPEIGITLDVGSGLFLPILKNDSIDSLKAVAEKMLEYKLKALDTSFDEEDLVGGNLSISYNPAENLVSTMPILFPNQSVMISVCSPIKELCFDENSQMVQKSFLYIGLAFDHRVINGSEAMRFLSRICAKLTAMNFNKGEAHEN